MTIVVGNLLRDAEAQSFVSVADADAFLAPEMRTAWQEATTEAKEAALVRASRWLAGAFTWRNTWLESADLRRVGDATARLAVEALTVDLYAADEPGAAIKREKFEGIEFEYRDARPSGVGAAGRSWPWLPGMLSGLVQGGALLRVTRS